MAGHKVREAIIWTIGVGLGAATVWTTTDRGRPNAATLGLLAWLWFVSYRFFRREQQLARFASYGHPANSVRALLADNHYEVAEVLDDNWVVFVRPGRDVQFRLRPGDDCAEVESGHMADPWRFETRASWVVRTQMPASLIAAVG